jgi:hypothetical protein
MTGTLICRKKTQNALVKITPPIHPAQGGQIIMWSFVPLLCETVGVALAIKQLKEEEEQTSNWQSSGSQ